MKSFNLEETDILLALLGRAGLGQCPPYNSMRYHQGSPYSQLRYGHTEASTWAVKILQYNNAIHPQLSLKRATTVPGLEM